MNGNRNSFWSLMLVLSFSVWGILAFTSSKKEKEDIVRIYVSVQGTGGSIFQTANHDLDTCTFKRQRLSRKAPLTGSATTVRVMSKAP